MPSKKTHYAVWSPEYGGSIVLSWEEAQSLIYGVTGVKHKGFYCHADAAYWLEQFKPKGFYRGTLPDLARSPYRDRQISDQFQIMKELNYDSRLR